MTFALFLDNHIGLHLVFSVEHPFSFPTWQFFGSASSVEALNSKMVEQHEVFELQTYC